VRLAAALAAVAIAFVASPSAARAEGGPLPVTWATEPLAWEGLAEVYPPGRTLKIAVRSRIDQIGNVVSDSWPLEVGEAKGRRRMILKDGSGTMERDGKSEPMPESMVREEQQQFEFYRYLQFAANRGPEMAALGVNTFQIAGAPLTWFRIDRAGNIVSAVNDVQTAEGTAHQTFRFDGFLRSSESVFPKHMEMLRDGRPFFTLDVTKFNAG